MSQLPIEYCHRESSYSTRYAKQPQIFNVATLCFEVCLKKAEVPLIQGGKALNSHCSNKLLGFQVSSHWHINSNIYSSKFGLYSLVYLQLLKEVGIHVSFCQCWYLPYMLLSIMVSILM